MAKAIETGLPKMKIEEAAAKRQAQIDSQAEAIIGVNKYRLDIEDPIDILDIDNTLVRQKQIDRINQMKATRDEAEVALALEHTDNSGKMGKAIFSNVPLTQHAKERQLVKYRMQLKLYPVDIRR